MSKLCIKGRGQAQVIVFLRCVQNGARVVLALVWLLSYSCHWPLLI